MEITENCELCLEPLKDHKNQGLESSKMLIAAHLPFFQNEIESDMCCVDCDTELRQFHTFFNKIKSAQLKREQQIVETVSLNPPQEIETLYLSTGKDSSKSRKREPKLKLKLKKVDIRRKDVDDSKLAEFVDMSCDLCYEKLESFAGALKHHEKVHNQQGYLTCCSRRFKKRSYLLEHLELHSNPEKYKCNICSKNMTSSSNLKVHIETKHLPQTRFQCDFCSKFFNSKFRLSSHIHEHAADFGRRSVVTTRRRTRKVTSQEKFCCEICGKELKSHSNLKVHVFTHSDPKEKSECKLCGHFLKNAYTMKKHLLRHKEIDENITCQHCGKKCTTKGALHSHLRMKHILQKNLPCSFCDKKFKQQIDLTEHEATHRGINLYNCLWCPAAFRFGASFRAHRKKIHPEEYEKIKPSWLRPN